MINKKVFGVIVCVIATLLVLTACGSKESDVETTVLDATTVSEEKTTETGSFGYVNEGNGDNYAIDIFTDVAPENEGVEDDTIVDEDDVENESNNKNDNTQQNSNTGDSSVNSSNDNQGFINNSGDNSDNNSNQETTTDDGWSEIY